MREREEGRKKNEVRCICTCICVVMERGSDGELTNPLVQSAPGLSELDSMYVPPGALDPQHLTVDQSDQVLMHLTLNNTG